MGNLMEPLIHHQVLLDSFSNLPSARKAFVDTVRQEVMKSALVTGLPKVSVIEVKAAYHHRASDRGISNLQKAVAAHHSLLHQPPATISYSVLVPLKPLPTDDLRKSASEIALKLDALATPAHEQSTTNLCLIFRKNCNGKCGCSLSKVSSAARFRLSQSPSKKAVQTAPKKHSLDSSPDWSVGQIIGLVIGCCLFLFGATVVLWLCIRKPDQDTNEWLAQNEHANYRKSKPESAGPLYQADDPLNGAKSGWYDPNPHLTDELSSDKPALPSNPNLLSEAKAALARSPLPDSSN